MSQTSVGDLCQLNIPHHYRVPVEKAKPCRKRKILAGGRAKHFCLDNMLPMLEASLSKRSNQELPEDCTSNDLSLQTVEPDAIHRVVGDEKVSKNCDPIERNDAIACPDDQSSDDSINPIHADNSNKKTLPSDRGKAKKDKGPIKKPPRQKVKRERKYKSKSSASYKDKYLSLESLPTPLYEENCSEDKPFVCPVCQSCFKQAFPLKRHMLIHSAVKPFFCTVCDFRCNDGSNLRKHMQTHSQKKRFSCPDCDYTCGRPDHLRNHRAKHTGLYQYECGICGYGCNQSSDLTRHMSVHVNNKPFKCDHCSFSTSRRCTLKIHVQARHSDATSFVCGVCSLTFSTALNLEKHMLLHQEKDDLCSVPESDDSKTEDPRLLQHCTADSKDGKEERSETEDSWQPSPCDSNSHQKSGMIAHIKTEPDTGFSEKVIGSSTHPADDI